MAVCPTRWTLRWIALNNFKRRYAQVLEFYANQSDLSMVKGLEEFDNYFCVCVLECLFLHTHSCHIALQKRGLSVGDGKTLLKRVKECLERDGTQEKAESFYDRTILEAVQLDVAMPVLRRGIRRQQRGAAQMQEPCEAELRKCFTDIYVKAFASVAGTIEDRVSSSGMQILADAEKLAMECDPRVLDQIMPHLDRFVTRYEFEESLNRCREEMRENSSDSVAPTMAEIDQHFCEDPLTRDLYPAVVSFLRWFKTPMATTAENERSYSTMRRLKTWLRSSMSDARFTWLAVCAIHKDELDSLELEKVVNEFINIKPGREKVFGRF